MNYWENICKINDRQEAKGRNKYGMILEDNKDLSFSERINHLQEELVDALKYCEHIKAYKSTHVSLNTLAKMIHNNAVEHGWWDEPRSFGDIVALCHSEISEALEEHRDGRPMAYVMRAQNGKPYHETDIENWKINEKPEGVAVEMIDCFIRILDWLAWAEVDIDELLMLKHEYNKTRPYKHGGKVM